MNINQILSQIADRGVQLRAEGEQLKVRAPKGTLTQETRELITQNKTELLQLLQSFSSTDSSDTLSEPLKPYEENSPYPPLSVNEQSLWFVWYLDPDSYSYNVSFAGRMPEASNISVWERVFEHLLKRHPGLHSCFPSLDNQPYRKVLETPVLDFQVIDAISWSLEEVRQKVKAIHREPFDLENGPLMRVRFFQQGPQGLSFIVSVHHIVCDGWSLNLMVEELPIIYHQLQTQPSTPLAPPSYSYPTFVHWQQELLESARGKQLWNYWRQKLESNLPILQLPTDYPRPPIQTYNGDSCVFSLSPELTQNLRMLADSKKVSLYILLLATYQILLYRYTLQEDIIVGSPVMGRSRSEFNGIFGHFVNMLPMRNTVKSTTTFTEFLTQVQQTVLEALDHQDFPLKLMVERLHPQRDSSYSPIIQTNFVLQAFEQMQLLAPSQDETSFSWGDLKFIPYNPALFEGQSDLDLEMSEINSQLGGGFKYNKDLFARSTIERIIGHFQTLLEGIVADPEQPVIRLPLLAATERHQLLVDGNDTALDYPDDKCIHQLFEEQVERTSDATAVVFENEKLSYRDLNSRANQLAHYLKGLGVGPEVLVGICVDRSLEMVISLLAILKAGGAYVPLDPSYPQERLSFMLADAQVPVLVTQEKLLELLPEIETQVVCVDRDWMSIAEETVENPHSSVKSDNLAYIIYTSGSTGKPKGVQIQHQSVVNFLSTMQLSPGLNQKDRLMAVTTLSFDIAGLEIYLPLISGAELLLMPLSVSKDGYELKSQIETHKPTIMQATPATWQMLLAAEWSSDSTPMKILCGGEALPSELAAQLLTSGKSLWNLYGPTETTIWSARFCVENSSSEEDNDLRQTISIGNPIGNTQIYILDSHLQPVPMGVPGELHIGGAGLARGYLNRPELTQEKFIPNPFGEGRLYKTGDKACFLEDGNIKYLGRFDYQVKVRGFRIELGEIEAVLNDHEQVQQCVVISREDSPGNKRLVAYVVSQNDIDITGLKAHLTEQLPEYMVPSILVPLETLPLTPNGKVDRKALPAPSTEVSRTTEFVAPQTEHQTQIAAIWREVLQSPEVGIYDNFFELGGTSILLMQVYSKLKAIFDTKLKVVDLLAYPTIYLLSQFIAGDIDAKSNQRSQVVYEKRLNKRLDKKQKSKANLRKQLRSKK